MRRTLRKLSLWLALALTVWWLWPQSPLRHPPGVRVTVEPGQLALPPKDLGERDGYRLTAVARYEITARVLRTKRYWVDGDKLVPYDVALGWGAMSDQAVLDQLRISQSNRFFFYEWRGAPPIPPREMAAQAANVHVIAADESVAAAVRRLRAGQFVQMRGYLVNVHRADGFQWRTSLRRDDTGNRACELFFVEAIRATDGLADDAAPAPGAGDGHSLTRVSL